ncbi:hypothetical protein EXIGLDRAFT_707147 [Exidia glandulosa HHB12029]|uniref:Uncharacterized protein n=1 Tax=Exidia glandulosa HHB12029 TaxID=1314781 RepID=A0A165ATQ3_EXIGL|nr:hypothetical protein EXIGLDRAFT_707147 [Exidia glandulosa HHB12029]
MRRRAQDTAYTVIFRSTYSSVVSASEPALCLSSKRSGSVSVWAMEQHRPCDARADAVSLSRSRGTVPGPVSTLKVAKYSIFLAVILADVAREAPFKLEVVLAVDIDPRQTIWWPSCAVDPQSECALQTYPAYYQRIEQSATPPAKRGQDCCYSRGSVGSPPRRAEETKRARKIGGRDGKVARSYSPESGIGTEVAQSGPSTLRASNFAWMLLTGVTVSARSLKTKREGRALVLTFELAGTEVAQSEPNTVEEEVLPVWKFAWTSLNVTRKSTLEATIEGEEVVDMLSIERAGRF